jgi:hypothetical protein
VQSQLQVEFGGVGVGMTHVTRARLDFQFKTALERRSPTRRV